VSEASGHLTIIVLNKTGEPGRVRVKTIDAEAKAGDDYEAVDEVLVFNQGQKQTSFDVTINDDDNWEPDEDFFAQLYDPETLEELHGADTKTRVTIIDDDKPGQICFENTKGVKASASEEFAEIVILRKNGSDGTVTVDYETKELDSTDQTATPGVDYESSKGTLVFGGGETQKTI
jgi:hypothetical protein